MTRTHRIQFPAADLRELCQDEVYFYLNEGSEREKILLHDYARIYESPGLYEQVVYARLKCQSPAVVADVLAASVAQSQMELSELRVLDLGAGNGMVGQELERHGVSRLIGVDILEQAKLATERDRPSVYDTYFVTDLLELSDVDREQLSAWSPNCLVSVAALGFGDIPPRAFVEALNVVAKDGWVAFNIKESFLDHGDESGFSRLVRELIFSQYLDLYHLRRYRHRLSIEGQPLYYFALGGRKNDDVPAAFLDALEHEAARNPGRG